MNRKTAVIFLGAFMCAGLFAAEELSFNAVSPRKTEIGQKPAITLVKNSDHFSLCREALERCREKDYFRVVLFGASNTERYMPCLHWGDVLETGLRSQFGRKFHVINSGICGNNTRQALARFERDVASFNPDIVIVTLGGNDRMPSVSEETYTANMEMIVDKIRALGAVPILQTYYKMLTSEMQPERAETFLKNMDIIRQIAARKNVFLIDQYWLFDQLDPAEHRYKLMLNPMHVNEKGNILIGIYILSAFGIPVSQIEHHEKLLPAAELFEAVRRKE